MAAQGAKEVYRREAIPEADRTCVTALCCVHGAFYFKYPECCGNEFTVECCGCCQTTYSTKCLDTQYHPAKCVGQNFCVDFRCALPCDNEVPCELSVMGLTCYKSKATTPAAPVQANQLQNQLQAPQVQQIRREA